MSGILFIYDDARVADLVNGLREAVRAPITVAGDFDYGLQEIFEKKPAYIFMQEEIKGVSCIAVAGHIKNLLRTTAPRLILLRDDPNRQMGAGRDIFDGHLELSGGALSLRDAILSILGEGAGIQSPVDARPPDREAETVGLGPDIDRLAAEMRASLETTACVQGPPSAVDDGVGGGDAQALPRDAEFPLASPFEEAEPHEISPMLAVDALGMVAEPSHDPAQSVPEVPMPSKEAGNLSPEDMPHPLATAPHPIAHDRFVGEEVAALEDALAMRTRRQTRKRICILAALILLLMGIGVYSRWSQTAPKSVSPGPNSPDGMAGTQPLQDRMPPPPPLPQFVSDAANDPAYGDSRPGWERRVSADFEALVFREQGRMRALQVISRQQAGLAPQVVDGLFQFAGGVVNEWQDEGLQGSYVVNHGRHGNGVEILRYSIPGTGSCAAIVVALP